MITKADILLVRSLSDRRFRQQHGLFVVEGPKMVGEALRSGWRIHAVYGVELGMRNEELGIKSEALRHSEEPEGRRGICERSEPLIEFVSPRDLERMSSLKTPQGILAVVEIPKRTEILRCTQDDADAAKTPNSSLLTPNLALDSVQDPGNLGTIIRTADWFGMRHIVCSPECADRFNPKAVQASMGALFRVDVEYRELTFPAGVPVFGAFMDGDNIYNVDFHAPGTAASGAEPAGVVAPIIVLGNEGRGISSEVAARVTRRVCIPSFDSAPESLNVAAAAAIFCSEIFRRR